MSIALQLLTADLPGVGGAAEGPLAEVRRAAADDAAAPRCGR